MTERTIEIHTEIAAKLNFAAHQSAFPLLRDLQVENLHPEERIEGLVLTLRANPAFVREKVWPVDRIAPQGSVSVRNRDLEVDGGYLLTLTESVRGTVTLQVEKDGEALTALTKPVELLAYNEWGGAGFMPELLAAFSMPNDPSVARVLRNASGVLRRAGKEDCIDGYESNSRRRVWEIASAIYTAIANLGLTYGVPPTSFESDGQKIRLPGQILDGGVATCLDTAMLFASAFEQAGLNPIVALPKGHALAGVWLQPEDLSGIVIDEAETLRKRIGLRELVLVETTCVTLHPAPSFSKALKAANDSIRPEDDDTFTAAIDVRRARAHRITPLGLPLEKPGPTGQGTVAVSELTLEEAPALPDFDVPNDQDEKPDTPQGRLERWQRRLLDLTLNNRLLHHRAAKASLRIICPQPGLLEDKLAEGTRIRIGAVPKPSAEGQDEELHRQRTGEVITEEYALDELEKRRVLVDLPADELSRHAVEIYRKARTALQEGGANTLYLAIGFLLWKRDQQDARRFRAPLILLPVALERKSVRSGIRMVTHDDEPRFNTTLLEMLHKDFGIDIQELDGELPTDESGIDVDGIWNRVRSAVKESPGFEVVEDVVLGHFSFAKYLMWKDLVDRTDALRENAVVRHLIDTPRDSYVTDIDFVEPSQIDRQFKPADLLTPLSADSSQMAAVATADRGKDFVIIGPPGTGKSQTISNLIAHLLGKDKTVLFVSEKTAALEVVYRRLNEIGLGRFCLELHSNKAQKTHVVRQLHTAWQMSGLKSSVDWQKQAEELQQLRDRLNRVVDHLHRKHRNGLTAHYAIGVKVRDEELASHVTLSWPTADYHDETALEGMRTAVKNLSIQAKAIGDVSSSPFHLVTKSQWGPQWEAQIAVRAGTLSEAVSDTERACDTLCKAIGISLPDRSMTRLDALEELSRLLVDSYRQPTAYALEPDGPDRIEALKEAAIRLKAYAEAQASLSCAYEPFTWRSLDGEDIGRRWEATKAMWWPKRFLVQRGIVREMRANGAREKPDPTRDAQTLTRLRQEGEAIDRLDRQLSDFKDWAGHTTEPSVAESLRHLGERARTAAAKLADGPQKLAETREKVRTLLHNDNDLLAPGGTVGRTAIAFLDSLESLRRTSSEFETVAGRSVWETFAPEDRALDQLRETVNTLVARRNELRAWCNWRRRRAEAIDANLWPLVEAVEQGWVPAEEIEKTFEAAYCAWWSAAIIGEDEVLRTFSTPEHEETVAKFRQVDDHFQRMTAQYVAAKLAGSLPKQDSIQKSSQWGMIRRELQKKRQHKPVRKLLEEAPEVMTSLAPCFMMSPLSVAQYLPPDQTLFDVVIFDEASQITVWDAVGSLARGRQVIIAGDPKQMPPTNFFARSDDDPDGDIDTEGDLESILDGMLSAGIPQQTLNLHYRSQKESLIAFSNARYYDNELITFPASDVTSRGVSLVRPNGFYARGKARHNEGEAKAIVAEILRRLTHPDPAVHKLSIGVVTFNSEQQNLIENLLDEARLRHPKIEWAFSREHTIEPVFVKNLETVQGDERDVILFSVTYGPDQSGHVTMNFGPLNREGGERRLNVAMTRAKAEMIIFSTLHPDRIDLSRTSARAVADLKHFLEYAEKGRSALGSAVFGSTGDFESPFEAAVARELGMKGWQVHPQVGVSAYRIDLGIVHPDAPGRYLAGVECDGAMYHSSAFARERDKIRQGVLKRLGWTLLRIWSSDWWTNQAGALEKVDNALRQHLEEDRRQQAQRANISAASADTEKRPADNQSELPPGTLGSETAPSPHPVDEGEIGEKATRDNHRQEAEGGKEREGELVQHVQRDTTALTDHNRYVVARFDKPGLEPDPNAFYSDAYTPRLSAMLDHVIDTEGPIHENVLVKRIARHHGFQRSGRQIRDVVMKLTKHRPERTQEKVGVFFWPQGTVKDRLAPVRYTGRNDELRKIEHICAEELGAINEALALGGDAAAVSRALGIARLSQSARDRIEKAVEQRRLFTAAQR